MRQLGNKDLSRVFLPASKIRNLEISRISDQSFFTLSLFARFLQLLGKEIIGVVARPCEKQVIELRYLWLPFLPLENILNLFVYINIP